MTELKYVLYRHIRLDKNKTFYVGIGNEKRPFVKTGRNIYWNRIVTKTNYEVEILKKDLSWEDACELEVMLISWYGRINNKTGILCNLTDGGEGSPGVIVSEASKEKKRKLMKGNLHALGCKHTLKQRKIKSQLLLGNTRSLGFIQSEIQIIKRSITQLSSVKSRGSSKYKGVTWNKLQQKWIAQLTIDGESKFLGVFICEDEAGLASKKVIDERLKELYITLEKLINDSK